MDDRRELERGSASQEEGNITEEHSFDELAKGVAEGTISRSKALKSVGAAVLGGMLSIFALPPRDADAARRRLPKTLWAVVDADGTFVRGKGTLEHAVKDGTGEYSVGFVRDVRNCAYTATTSDAVVYTTGVGQDSLTFDDWVKVYTAGANGLEDAPFHLVVNC